MNMVGSAYAANIAGLRSELYFLFLIAAIVDFDRGCRASIGRLDFTSKYFGVLPRQHHPGHLQQAEGIANGSTGFAMAYREPLHYGSGGDVSLSWLNRMKSLPNDIFTGSLLA